MASKAPAVSEALVHLWLEKKGHKVLNLGVDTDTVPALSLLT
jgi:hypothetical protein